MLVRINNALIDPAKVSHVVQDPEDINRVTAFFDNGENLVFVGQEAAELWKLLDDTAGDWRKED